MLNTVGNAIRLLGGRQDRIIIIVTAAILFIALAYVLASYPTDYDVLNFHEQAESVKAGMLPYTEFVFEFPPLALAFFMIPSIFTSDVDVYAAIFAIEVVISAIIALCYILRICEKLGLNKYVVSVVYVALILIYMTHLIRKFDIIPMTMVVASIYYYLERRFGLAYGLAAAGALVKMYPALILAVFLIANVLEGGPERRRNLALGAVACVIVFLIAFLPLSMAGVPLTDSMSFITFHTERGFQVESLVGAIVQALGLLGLTSFDIVYANDTQDVIGPICDALLPCWNWVLLLTILATLAISALRIRESYITEGHLDGRIVIVTCAVAIMAFILMNKVFSTQYMVWLFPLMALITAMVCGKRNILLTAVLMVAMEGAARGILFFLPGEPQYVFFNIVRDVMLVALFLILLRSLWNRNGDPGGLLHSADRS